MVGGRGACPRYCAPRYGPQLYILLQSTLPGKTCQFSLHYRHILSIGPVLELIPPCLQLYPPYYVESTVFTLPIQEGLYGLSVYLLLCLTAIRFLKLTEKVDYSYWRLIISSFLIATTLLIPKFFTIVAKELPMAEILLNLNQTQNDLGSDTELLPVNIEEDEKKVVLLTTDLQHQFAFNNMFFLLYRQIVLQIVPMFVLCVILSSTIKKSCMACFYPHSKKLRYDKVPALLSLIFLIFNIGECTILMMRILIEIPPAPLYSWSKLSVSLMCACKPLVYFANRERKEKREKYSWWTEIVTASYE